MKFGRLGFSAVRGIAYATSARRMAADIGSPVAVSPWNDMAVAQLAGWGDTRFPWPIIFQRHREADRLDMAIWSGRTLCALGLATTTRVAVFLRFLEGDPSPACPLRGRRVLIALDVAASYAQAIGRRELRLQPINERLVDLYESVYGFERIEVKGQDPYWRKEV